MKNPVLYITSILLSVIMTGCLSENRRRDVARIEGDRFIISFDLRWNEEKRYEVADLYELDSALVDAVFRKESSYTDDSVLWTIELAGRYMAVVSKRIEPEESPLILVDDILLIDDGWVRRDEVNGRPPVRFGINRLNNDYAVEFVHNDTLTTFRLKGFRNAVNVRLAGSFNGWNTMNTPLEKSMIRVKDEMEEGWVVTIRLDPGKHTYKYIVDGKWITDPSNTIREREEGRGLVSVLFSPNLVFKLENREARQVVVTGNFINWDRRGLLMKQENGNWELPVYLSNGTWSYKFIADREWLPDPSNQDNRQDASGNVNSFISIGEKHRFRLNGFTSAEKIVLTGSFNNWNDNELVMMRDSAGWVLDYVTGPGNWEYKFIADGEWMPDPENPVTTGSGDYINSLISVKPNHTFTLSGFEDAGEVVVTGTFNNWSRDNYRMIRRGGEWILSLNLKKGKVLYKFIVDGEWITDPGNPNWEDNQYGTGNSVLWIE